MDPLYIEIASFLTGGVVGFVTGLWRRKPPTEIIKEVVKTVVETQVVEVEKVIYEQLIAPALVASEDEPTGVIEAEPVDLESSLLQPISEPEVLDEPIDILDDDGVPLFTEQELQRPLVPSPARIQVLFKCADGSKYYKNLFKHSVTDPMLWKSKRFALHKDKGKLLVYEEIV